MFLGCGEQSLKLEDQGKGWRTQIERVNFWQLGASSLRLGKGNKSAGAGEWLGQTTPASLHYLDVVEHQVSWRIEGSRSYNGTQGEFGIAREVDGGGGLSGGVKCSAESAQCCRCHLWYLCPETMKVLWHPEAWFSNLLQYCAAFLSFIQYIFIGHR